MKENRLIAASRLALLAGVIGGCASAPPSSPPSSQPSSPPAPVEAPAKAQSSNPAGLNLSGYPVAFREGYTVGCESGRNGGKRRDEGRYKADMNYMMGWNDGYSICAGRK